MFRNFRRRQSTRSPFRRGFTLPEVLVSTAIIGTLATASMASFSSIRVKARDLKRIADTGQFRTALELYYQAHGGYPGDGQRGSGGMPIGSPEYDVLSDAGFGKAASGTVFMESIPQNPAPFGVTYLYRSLNADGTDCDQPTCASFAILFALEREQAGLDAGPHAMTPVGPLEPKGFPVDAMRIVGTTGFAGTQARIDAVVTTSTDQVVSVVNSEPVKKANEFVVAPAVAISTAANAAYASSQFGGYLFFFLTQPASLFGMRRKRNWGTVFNSISHMPVDLAIIRLRRDSDGRVMQSTVSDAEGRYSFLVHPGSYRIEVSKAGIVFPSVVDVSMKEDGIYRDLYHGGRIDAGTDDMLLVRNIPVDPDGLVLPDIEVLKTQSKKMLHKSIALISPVLGGIVFVMRPSPFVALLFAAEVVLYFLFKRLAEPMPLKNWGTVFHQVSQEPVPKAIVRIFSARFNKLLETHVTDLFGRYHFRVMDNVYYLTVSKEGFRKTETEPIDLAGTFSPVIIASDLPLSPLEGALIVATRKKDPADAKPKKSLLVGPQSYAARLGPNMPSLPDSMKGEDESAREHVEKMPEAPSEGPDVPEFLRGTAEELAPKKDDVPVAAKGDEEEKPPTTHGGAWHRDL